MRMRVCSIFLQVSTQNEDPFTVVCNGNLLSDLVIPFLDGFEVLKVSVLGDNDVNFETITDLTKKRF